jgi:hypothetical protein
LRPGLWLASLMMLEKTAACRPGRHGALSV